MRRRCRPSAALPDRGLGDGAWEEAEPDRVLATVLFSDIVGSTERAAELGDRGWRDVLERHHSLVRRQLLRFRGQEVDTAGDGFFASFDGPARAVLWLRDRRRRPRPRPRGQSRAAHGGVRDRSGKIAGIAVHTGARVAARAAPGEVLVSHTVSDLVAGSGIQFEARGSHELKGIPGEWQLFRVDPVSAR